MLRRLNGVHPIVKQYSFRRVQEKRRSGCARDIYGRCTRCLTVKSRRSIFGGTLAQTTFMFVLTCASCSQCSCLPVLKLSPQSRNHAGFPFTVVCVTGTFSDNLGFVGVGSALGVLEHPRPWRCLGAVAVSRTNIPAFRSWYSLLVYVAHQRGAKQDAHTKNIVKAPTSSWVVGLERTATAYKLPRTAARVHYLKLDRFIVV